MVDRERQNYWQDYDQEDLDQDFQNYGRERYYASSPAAYGNEPDWRRRGTNRYNQTESYMRRGTGWQNLQWQENPEELNWGYTEVWRVPGPMTGRGPRSYRRPDEHIRDEIHQRLTQHGQLDASEIDVQVEDGEVTLTGTVNSRREKRMAEDTVESVAGVRDINNRITIDQMRDIRSSMQGRPGQQQGQQSMQGQGSMQGQQSMQGEKTGQGQQGRQGQQTTQGQTQQSGQVGQNLNPGRELPSSGT